MALDRLSRSLHSDVCDSDGLRDAAIHSTISGSGGRRDCATSNISKSTDIERRKMRHHEGVHVLPKYVSRSVNVLRFRAMCAQNGQTGAKVYEEECLLLFF